MPIVDRIQRLFLACLPAAMTLMVESSVLAAEPAGPASAAFPLLPEEPAVKRYDSAPTRAHTPPAQSQPYRVQPSAAYATSFATSYPTPYAPSYDILPAPSPASSYAPASTPAAEPPAQAPVAAEASRPSGGDSESSRKRSDNWLVSIEGVTHAPVDVGVQAGIEIPMGLHLFGGYGWVPSQYLSFVTSAAALASDADSGSAALLKSGFQSGRTWRAQLGIRPFSRSGVYLDGGYSEVSLEGSIDTAALGFATGSALHVQSKLRMWLVELGYKTDIADRIVLGIAAGVMGTLDAETHVDAIETPLGQDPFTEAAADVDEQLESHGIVPTLTLRLGVDLI